MSDVIKLLPDSVANQIAAGEVIQRPASVIKELVENAVDAGATNIQIILKDAGRTLIQVIDNGMGMSATDARLAFERHSTSKIRNAQDLFALRTMGFRGEALASIAAISQVELRTQRKDEPMGTVIEIAASVCERQEAFYGNQGSNFMVKNIFFNVPARRKFLKSNQVEMSNIVREFEKLALVNPSIEFTLIHNDNTMYKLMSGNFRQRIVSLFGRTFDSHLIPVNLDTNLIRIEGFVCKPEHAKKRSSQQFMFVNGRYMRHPYFHKAIVSCYDQLIPDETQPNYFLNFTVDPESIDVNIHPTKTEIKFENEVTIWPIISAAVKETIGRFSIAPSIDFDNEDAPELPVYTTEKDLIAPSIDLDQSYNPFSSSEGHSSSSVSSPSTALKSSRISSPKSDITNNWDDLYSNFEKSKIDSLSLPDEDESVVDSLLQEAQPAVENVIQPSRLMASETPTAPLCMQFKERYIVSPSKSGMMVVDQHRAHVLVLFERYMANKSQGAIHSQRRLFPEEISLTTSQNLILQELEPEMRQMGFDLSFIGDNTWSINATPADIESMDVTDLILQVIESVHEGGDKISDKIYEHLALEVAKKSAIPVGRIMSVDEMDNLMSQLFMLSKPNYTPDGKLVISVISTDYIQKLFQ